MAGWHQQLNGHGFGWTLGVGDGQGDLACCDSWGRKESDTTERLNCWSPCPLLARVLVSWPQEFSLPPVLSLSPQQHGSWALSAPSAGAEVLKLLPDGKPRLPTSQESVILRLSSSA